MNKSVTFAILVSFLAVPAFAAQTAVGPDAARQAHRAQLIEERRARGPEAERTKKPAGEESKMSKFWKNEGERSGLGNTGSRAGSFLRNLNPVPFFAEQDRRYKERQASAQK
ncbi:MAG TPA: hypothetical protein VL404_06535 [Candidatus Eisenbacteria bacterium]|jgi:hypothetical protein|nr:hypothetical protein [Candidatus Eisenbacteria bacterium]